MKFVQGPGGGGGGGGGGGPAPHTGPPPVESDIGNIWAETKTDTGSSYYYNAKTRVTSWDRPEGPNVTVMSHEEVS